MRILKGFLVFSASGTAGSLLFTALIWAETGATGGASRVVALWLGFFVGVAVFTALASLVLRRITFSRNKTTVGHNGPVTTRRILQVLRKKSITTYTLAIKRSRTETVISLTRRSTPCDTY